MGLHSTVAALADGVRLHAHVQHQVPPVYARAANQGCEIFPIQDQIDKFFYLDFLIKNKIEAIVITPSTSNLIIKSKNFTQKNLRYLKN